MITQDQKQKQGIGHVESGNMIKLKSLLKEDSDKLYMGQQKVTVRQIDMYYALYRLANNTILAYPQDQSRLFEMIGKFGFNEVIDPLTNIINNKYGNKGFFVIKGEEFDATKPIEYIFIKNN